jgi:hypothetical protein
VGGGVLLSRASDRIERTTVALIAACLIHATPDTGRHKFLTLDIYKPYANLN